MPKQIDYPRASMKNSLALCDAVNDLGGECSIEMAAEKLGKQPSSGAYRALVGAAVKYGLLVSKKGQLAVTQLFRDIKLAYDQEEEIKEMQKAFLSPPLFASVFSRFEDRPLPVNHFEKLLIREFDVPDNFASRVASYFLEGAKHCGLLGEDHILSKANGNTDEVIENSDDLEEEPEPVESAQRQNHIEPVQPPEVDAAHEKDGKFSVRIKGPGIDSLIVVNEEEDLDIVKAMLKKVQKKLQLAEQEWDE